MLIAAMWKRGTPPVAGGLLDQTASIVQACDMIWAEQARWKRDKQLMDMDE